MPVAAVAATVVAVVAAAAAAEMIVADYAASWTLRLGLGSVHGDGNHQLHLRRPSRD